MADGRSATPSDVELPADEPPAQDRLSRHKVFEIILDKWAPAIIAGAFLAFLVPWLTAQQTRESAFRERQHKVWEELSTAMTAMINSRERMIEFIRSYDPVLVEQMADERKQALKAEAAKHEDKWRADTRIFVNVLGIAEYYFDASVRAEIEAFRVWNRARNAEFKSKPAVEWVTGNQYAQRRDQLMLAIRASLRG